MKQFQIIFILSVLLILILIGTAGYHWLEGWNYLDSLYMTIIILSTVGLGEFRNLDYTGKIFTITLICFGAAFAGYALNVLGQRLLESQFGTFLSRRKMEKETKKLNHHFIVCGAGRVGTRVIRELKQENASFVVIEKDAALAERLIEEGILVIIGDASDEEVLIQAGVEKARALVASLSTDAENVYVTLTAKGLRSDLVIVTRAQEESARSKLLKAGASKVILPYQSAGLILAQAILKPHVSHFLESVATGEMAALNLQLAEVYIADQSPHANQTLQNCGIRQKLGIIIVAIKKKNGKMLFNPTSESVIEAGDFLIALGPAENIRQLNEMESVASPS
jgi:voltage-gated potassium channel